MKKIILNLVGVVVNDTVKQENVKVQVFQRSSTLHIVSFLHYTVLYHPSWYGSFLAT